MNIKTVECILSSNVHNWDVAKKLLTTLQTANISHTKLGIVASSTITIGTDNWGNVNEWKEKYDNAIGGVMGK